MAYRLILYKISLKDRSRPKSGAQDAAEYAKILTASVLLYGIRGTSIVCTPTDEYKYFMGIDLDVLSIGDNWLTKVNQSELLKEDHRTNYELD